MYMGQVCIDVATLQWGMFVYLGRVCKCGESSVIHADTATQWHGGGSSCSSIALCGRRKVVIYWSSCQQPCTLAVTADESGWGITIYSAVVIGEVVAAGGSED